MKLPVNDQMHQEQANDGAPDRLNRKRPQLPDRVPGDSDREGAGPAPMAGFRAGKRTWLSWRGWLHSLRRHPLHSALAILIVVTGMVAGAVYAGDPLLVAITTLLTCMCLAIALIFHPAPGFGRREHMHKIRERFEKLEDRAWELRESEERYRSLVEAFGDIWAVRDREGCIRDCNQAFADCLGQSKEALLGSQLEFGFVPPSAKCRDNHVEPAETVIETPQGKRWFAWFDLPMRDTKSGETVQISVGRDITRHKLAARLEARARRQAEEASNAKTRFLAMVSHEMRTPLNGILGMAKLVAQTRLTPEQENYVSAIETSGTALSSLIEDMLDLTAAEAGRLELKPDEFDPRELIEGISELLASRAHEKSLGFGVYIDPHLPKRLVGDAQRIRQVITNLAGNAVKYTNKGGVSILCHWHQPSEDRENDRFEGLVVDVRDTGPGIPFKTREKLFCEFERGADRATQSESGAGLGLAIANVLAGQMDGSVELAKSGKKGSTFRFAVPLLGVPKCHAAKKELSEASTDAALDATGLQNRRVLLVSLKPGERESLTLQLRSRGARVTSRADVKQALSWLAGKNMGEVDIIIDCADPVRSKEAVSALAAIDNRPRNLVTLLAPGAQQLMPALRAAGATAWLVRPVREASLFAVLCGKNTEDDGEDLAGSLRSAIPDAPELPLGHCNPEKAGEVLLAEDNDINALLVSAALKRSGFSVDRARDGIEAESLFQEKLKAGKIGYVLVLTDMHMPRRGGMETIRALRRLERKGSNEKTPIYALTADNAPQLEADIAAAGGNGLLVKPVNPQDLVDLALASAGNERAYHSRDVA